MVGLLRLADRYHRQCEVFFASLHASDRLCTTWPVITECSFALQRNRDAFFDWLQHGGITVIDFSVGDVAVMRKWASRYRDREVDFADASIVWLADRQRTNLIATTDFNDFETYRLPNRKAFKNLLAR
ncbi:MAG: type II toxin-antitoxin system VapC family toxin [Burkholderiales bacterium]